MHQPIDKVTWVERNRLKANNYNPNNVFTPEMKLLKLSILEDGWTQPIVVREGSFEIVDGFHRWTVAGDPEIKARNNDRVPCVFLRNNAGRDDQMLSTVRHNRARGVHHVLKMASIVRELIDKQGMSDEEVGVRLGMDREEVERLYDSSGMTERGSSKAFSEAWAPKEGGSKG